MSAEVSGHGEAPRRRAGVAALRMYWDVKMEARAEDGYVIGEELPGGGMSTVHLGMSVALQRSVVLKSVPAGRATPELAARLAQEAEVLGRLGHPDIASFVEYKVIAGCPRLVMEQVEGVPLREFLTREFPPPGGAVPGLPGAVLSLGQKVALLERLARAISYAHTRGGVAHRDLKPENVLVRADMSPVVVDFGIASFMDTAGGKLSHLTRTNMAAGTAKYMAPEQAAGECRQPAVADVYALGVMLFELLCGALPVEYRGETEVVYLKRVLEEEPRRLLEVMPGLPRGRDLEAICAVALSRAPDKRPSAEALAEDLRRWLERKPVQARPPGPLERMWLAVRRRPKMWAGVFLSAAGLATLAVVLAFQTWRAERAEAQSRRMEADALAALAAEAMARGTQAEALPDLIRALRLDPENEVAGWLAGQALLDQLPLVRAATVPFPDRESLETSPWLVTRGDGAFLIKDRDGEGLLYRAVVAEAGDALRNVPWPEGAGQQAVRCRDVAVSPDEALVAVVLAEGEVRVYAAADGRLLWEQGGGAALDHGVRFSCSGRRVLQVMCLGKGAEARGRVRVFESESGRSAGAVRELPAELDRWRMELTPDDAWLVVGGSQPRLLRSYPLAGGEGHDLLPLWQGGAGAGAVYGMCPVAGTTRILVSGQGTGYRMLCVDVATGARVWDAPVIPPVRRYTLGLGKALAAPDGVHFVVSGSDGWSCLHRLADGAAAGPAFFCGAGSSHQPAFIGTEHLMLSGGSDSAVWNWKTGQRTARVAEGNVMACRDGVFLQRTRKELALWRMNGREGVRAEFTMGEGKAGFDLDADRRRMLLAGAGGQAEVVDLATLQRVGAALPHGLAAEDKVRRLVRRPRLAAHGSRAVVWQDERTLAVHDLQGQEAPVVFSGGEVTVQAAALSPDGHTLALVLENGVMEAWQVPGHRLLHRTTELCRAPDEARADNEPVRAMCLEFSPDGSVLALGGEHYCLVAVWHTADWSRRQPAAAMAHSVADLCFPPGGGQAVWTGDWAGRCTFFQEPGYADGIVAPVLQLDAPVQDVAVSADGRWVAAGGLSRKAFVIRTEPLELAAEALKHTGEVTAVDWSPDGTRLLTATADGEVMIWHRASRRRMFSWPQDAPVLQAAFALGGRRIVLARMDGKVLVRELYAGGRMPEGSAEVLEEMGGYRVEDDGQLVPVSRQRGE